MTRPSVGGEEKGDREGDTRVVYRSSSFFYSLHMRFLPCIVSLSSCLLAYLFLSSILLLKKNTSVCIDSDRENCARPFVPFKQRYRFASRYSLLGCAIEKNFSTLLTAILCFLHDERKFISRERRLVKEDFHHRFCGPRNEASTIEKATKRIGGNQTTTLFAITREPVDRFISGFVDKCIKEETWRSHPDRCCGCKRDIHCFVDKMYNRIIKKSRGEKQRTSFDDDHFFPQSWRCEFSSHLREYTILDFSAADSSDFYTKLLKLLHDHGVPSSSLSLIESSLHSSRTDHSTIQSEERKEFEKRIRSSPSIMEKIARMYYYDFILFHYPLPVLLK